MVDDPLLPPVGDLPPAPAPRRGRVTCEFCECELTANGEVLKVSDKAKKHRKHEQTIEERDEKIAGLEKELRDARTRITELSATAQKSGFDLTL